MKIDFPNRPLRLNYRWEQADGTGHGQRVGEERIVRINRHFRFDARCSVASYTNHRARGSGFLPVWISHRIPPSGPNRDARHGASDILADTSPAFRALFAHGLRQRWPVNRSARAAPRSAGASTRTAAASGDSPPAGASSSGRRRGVRELILALQAVCLARRRGG
jgi:hypothetical protein